MSGRIIELLNANPIAVITLLITCTSFLHPICVAIINNLHNTKIRKLEFSHQETIKQFETYYANKEQAYSKFIEDAGSLIFDIKNANSHRAIFVSLHNAMLLCDEDKFPMFDEFLEIVNRHLLQIDQPSLEWETNYLHKLSELSKALNSELCSITSAIKKMRPK